VTLAVLIEYVDRFAERARLGWAEPLPTYRWAHALADQLRREGVTMSGITDPVTNNPAPPLPRPPAPPVPVPPPPKPAAAPATSTGPKPIPLPPGPTPIFPTPPPVDPRK
jgi:hypothetical protein